MAESQIHISLVRQLGQYVENNYKIDIGFILLDLPENFAGNKPPIIGGFRPDLYVRTKDTLIIGEAKTTEDWNRRHSLSQYKSYYQECANYNGFGIFILAVPWSIERSIKNRLKYMFGEKETRQVSIIIISDMFRGQYAKD